MTYLTLTIINLLFAYTNANGCEDFCIEQCSIVNGNYTNECQNCSIDYMCNPLSEHYIEPWIPNIISPIYNNKTIIDSAYGYIKYIDMDYYMMKYYKDGDNLTNKSRQSKKYRQNIFIDLLEYTNKTFLNLSDSWVQIKKYLEYLEL